MPAIGVHHTATSDRPWDGPQNKANLRNDEDAAYYRKAFAWYDPDGDPNVKSTYKFIHHFVDSSGAIGAASVRACVNGIAILNGARGGANIPDSDRRGVWRHLAAHLRDADMEPAELKALEELLLERRAWQARLEVRAEEGQRPQIRGYAAVFDVLSEDLGGFRERIARGAFAGAENHDVRALWNHNSDYVLGRTVSGTLRLIEDETGLRVVIDPPDTQWARDALVSIQRGDVSQMSFGFIALDDTWETRDDGTLIRTLRKVRLFDVSPVTFPAYPQTSVAVRSKLDLLRARERVQGDGGDAVRAHLELLLKEIQIREKECEP